ncbi:hypothetical protein D3C75_692870 [compost metagenome]
MVDNGAILGEKHELAGLPQPGALHGGFDFLQGQIDDEAADEGQVGLAVDRGENGHHRHALAQGVLDIVGGHKHRFLRNGQGIPGLHLIIRLADRKAGGGQKPPVRGFEKQPCRLRVVERHIAAQLRLDGFLFIHGHTGAVLHPLLDQRGIGYGPGGL